MFNIKDKHVMSFPYFKFLKEQKEIFQNIKKMFNAKNVSKIKLKNPIKCILMYFKL